MFAAWEQLEPGGRAASPDVIANAIAFLAAPSTQFILNPAVTLPL
jgi:3-oxoacyl-[acyl-carrier protein] reductase